MNSLKKFIVVSFLVLSISSFIFGNRTFEKLISVNASGTCLTITSPANGATGVPLSGSINWTDGCPGASNYDIYLGNPSITSNCTSNFGSMTFIGSRSNPTATIPYSGLSNSTQYCVRIWRTATSIAYINLFTTIASASSTAYWPFNEGSGSTVSGGGWNYQGNLVNTTWQPAANCVSGTCLSFNGTTSYVQLASPGRQSVPITYSAWIRTTASVGAILGNYNGNVRAGPIFFVTGGKAALHNGAAATVSSASNVNDGAWHMITVTVNSSNIAQMYVDGQPNGGSITYPWNANNTDNLRLGSAYLSNATAFPFNGFLDEIRIYDTALTAAQVAALYTPPSSANKGEGLYIRGGLISIGDLEWNRDLNSSANAFHPAVIINNDATYFNMFKNDFRVKDYSIREQQ